MQAPSHVTQKISRPPLTSPVTSSPSPSPRVQPGRSFADAVRPRTTPQAAYPAGRVSGANIKQSSTTARRVEPSHAGVAATTKKSSCTRADVAYAEGDGYPRGRTKNAGHPAQDDIAVDVKRSADTRRVVEPARSTSAPKSKKADTASATTANPGAAVSTKENPRRAPSSGTGSSRKPKPEDVVEITSSEDEAVTLADRPLDPGDSMYRAPFNARSRVATVQRLRESTPVTTRAASSNRRLNDNENMTQVQPLASPAVINTAAEIQAVPRPRPKPRRIAKKVKPSAIVRSSDEEDQAVDVDQGGPNAISQSPRTPARRWSQLSLADEDLPSMSDILRQENSTTDRQDRRSVDFIDAEAVESGPDHEHSEDEVDCPMENNEYDYNDPFIDDSRQSDGALSQDDAMRSRRGSSASSMNMNVDGEYVGIQDDDPVEQAYKDRERKRIINDDELATTLLGVAKNRAFLLKALQMLQSNEGPDPEIPEDEDRQMELATRDSLLELLGGSTTKRRRSEEAYSPVATVPSHAAKGKGRAISLDRPDLEETRSSDEGLSDYERRDRKRLRTAMELSKRDRQRKAGQPSRAPVVDSPTVKTESMVVAMESLPSPQTPCPPARPKKQQAAPAKKSTTSRRTKKKLTDLTTGIGEDTTTAATQPSSSATNTAGQTISSRVPIRPKINELPIDMSDAVMRSTVRGKLYHLSRDRHLKSWNPSLVGPGFVKGCAWTVQCPDIDGELVLSFLSFAQDGDVGNPSRMDISVVHCLQLNHNTNRFHAVTKEGTPFTFVTSGFLEASQLMAPSDVGLKQKFVKIIPHDGEHQRMASASCAMFGFESMNTQYARHALQFSTRAEYTPNTPNKSSSSPGTGKPVAPGMFSGASSSGSGLRVSADSFSLPHTADVPVFDARDVDEFDPQTDLHDLNAKLPRWRDEIPYGSFVVVGYTMTAFFSSSREWTLGLNLQWAIIVGSPDGKTD